MVSCKALRGFLRDVRIAHHIRGRIRLQLDGRAVSIDVPRVEAAWVLSDEECAARSSSRR